MFKNVAFCKNGKTEIVKKDLFLVGLITLKNNIIRLSVHRILYELSCTIVLHTLVNLSVWTCSCLKTEVHRSSAIAFQRIKISCYI